MDQYSGLGFAAIYDACSRHMTYVWFDHRPFDDESREFVLDRAQAGMRRPRADL